MKPTIQKITGRHACRATLPAIWFRSSLRTGLEPKLLAILTSIFMAHHLSRTIRDRSFPRPAGQMNLSSQHHLTLNNTGWKELHGAFSGIDDPPSTVPFSQTTADINKMADNQSSKDNQNIVDHGRPSKASLLERNYYK